MLHYPAPAPAANLPRGRHPQIWLMIGRRRRDPTDPKLATTPPPIRELLLLIIFLESSVAMEEEAVQILHELNCKCLLVHHQLSNQAY
jgi:hypothetical protein